MMNQQRYLSMQSRSAGDVDLRARESSRQFSVFVSNVCLE